MAAALLIAALVRSFLAAAILEPFLLGSGFCDLTMAAALLIAALVRSFLYLCLFRFALVLWRLLPRPAFMVTARVDLEGLWDSFALLVVTTKPLLSAAALTPTALVLTSPLYLIAFLLVRLHASVEKGFFTPLFLRRKQELSLMIPHAISEETFMVTSLVEVNQAIKATYRTCTGGTGRSSDRTCRTFAANA